MDGDNSKPPSLEIQDLPSELLFAIFHRLNDLDLDKVQKVCTRWCAIVDEWIGREVSTSTKMTVYPNEPELMISKEGIHLISFIGVKSFEVEPANTEYLLEPPSSPPPAFLRPYLLKSLSVYGSIHPDLFTSLTGSLINLTVFEITLPALAHIPNQSLVHLNFPCLKKLKVNSLTILLSSMGLRYNLDDDEAVALPNLKTLMTERRFRFLVLLQVQIPIESVEDLDATRDLIRFIHAHPALEDLTVEMLFNPDYEPMQPRAYEDNLRAIISEIRERDCCPSLKRMEIVNWDRYERWPQLEVWKEFVMKLSSLRSLTFNTDRISNNMLSTLCSRNASTVEEFVVYQDNYHFDPHHHPPEGPLNCSILSQLKCVHKLGLIVFGQITGTQYLPSTLRTLYLSAIMTSNDSEHILLRLPNLQRLHLELRRFRNGEEEYGVALDALRQFVQNRQMAHFRLQSYQFYENPLPTEGIPNGDPVNPTPLATMTYQETCLCWDLNEDGYYVNGDKFHLPRNAN